MAKPYCKVGKAMLARVVKCIPKTTAPFLQIIAHRYRPDLVGKPTPCEQCKHRFACLIDPEAKLVYEEIA